MDLPPAALPEPESPGSATEPRQRWRLVVARGPETRTTRDEADAWSAALEASRLPLARTEGDRPRARISFGAPLPVGMAANGELIDIVLTERLPAWRVREAVLQGLPPGWRLIDLFDVWLAGPALAGRVAAADYRIVLAVAPLADIAAACTRLIAARTLPRDRSKGDRIVSYDLRPLLIDVRVVDPGPPIAVVARTRFHPELGTGRPEEVIAVLEGEVGRMLPVASITRERLLLTEDLAGEREPG